MATTSNPHQWKYDVFVSFRGEDIRKSFMDHLFKDFRQKGIHAFSDDKELPKGEEIYPELNKAIEESRFLLVIFSKNYASSSWCLRELVKILECKQIGDHKHEVRLIFYDVKPNVVRKQTASYAEAFEKHESSNRTEAAEWRKALFMAADLSGWDLQDMTNGYESKFIDSISKEILERLHHGPLHVGENLVGVYSRVDESNLLRFVGSDKVHIIGICGIGGIGKTTFAKALYNKLHINFEECSFCEDVQGIAKRHGLAQVQVQLIDDIMKTRALTVSNVSDGVMVLKRIVASKRILLLLDDVDHTDQIDALAGSRCWFFPGSVIIFTCKDKQLLSSYQVDEIYDMGFLDDDEALELFSLHAFGEKHPNEDFKELADEVVEYVKGHPLALKVLGRFLSKKAMHEWKSELDKLRVYPIPNVQKVLRLSYDGLDFNQKRIFLDIAYAFIGEDKDISSSVLDSCNGFADTNIRVLVDKALITISMSEKLQMHHLIQKMAMEIVCEESNMRRLRIQSKDLEENEVKETVEVLVVLLEKSSQAVHMDAKAFARMKNLRILKIYDPELEWFGRPCSLALMLPKDFKVNYTGRLEFLSNKLSFLCWHGFPFKNLPSDFYPENLVVINLSYSHIKNLWTNAKGFRRLKVMKLCHCHNLTSTPDFTEITNLKELYLDGCVNLVNVHPSIGMLKMLVVLSMRNCSGVKSFEYISELESLQVMDLSGCSKVDEFPEFMCTIKTFVELGVDRTAIMKLPSFLSSLSNLYEWIRSRRWTLISQPSCFPSKLQHPQSLVIPSLGSLCSLRELDLSHCNILQVSDNIGSLSCLEGLNLGGNNFTSLPGSLSQLSLLSRLILDGCQSLKAIPKVSPVIWSISAENCTSLQKVHIMKRDHGETRYFLRGCPKLWSKSESESESESEGRRHVCCMVKVDLDTSITSHGSRNKASIIRYIISSCVCEALSVQKRYWLDICLGGNKGIPEWFRNQSKGYDDIKVELPAGHIKGHVTCVVFTPKMPHYNLRYYMKNVNGAASDYAFIRGFHSIRNHDTVTWLHYTTISCVSRKERGDFATFSFEKYEDEELNDEVKEWGVRLICDEEEMDFIRMMEELPSPTIDGGCIRLSSAPDHVIRDDINLVW